MHKCSKCGMEFDGNFCPRCGERFAEEKTCPKCGATLSGSAKFCPECGHSFYETPAAKPAPVAEPEPVAAPEPAPLTEKPEKTGKPVTAGVRKLYAAVSVLPAVLLGLFSVLLFLIFLAPVAVTGGGSLMGVKIPSMSYGNVYAGSDYAGMSFAGSVTALIAFAALAVFVAFLVAVANVFCKLRDKRYTVAGKKIFLRNILTAVGYILFFALFVISCILMGQIASAGGGLGMMKAGAAPILVLVFTLVCSLAALACAFAGVHLRKTYPALIEEQEERIAAAKPTRAETWIKRHKAWTAGISALLVVAIAVGIAVPVGLSNRHNGTYYAYNGDTEEYDTTRYYKLSGNSWVNENGEKGKISFDGKKAILTYDAMEGEDIFGDLAEETGEAEGMEATIDSDVLNIGGVVYAKEKHGHMTDRGECACGHLNLQVELKEDGTYCITGPGLFKGGDLVIPGEHLGTPITEIAHGAFQDNWTNDDYHGVENLEISEGVTTIGRSAFYCLNPKSVIIGSSVTSIGSMAFCGCKKLTSVTIGSGVTEIKDMAFNDCTALKSIDIPASVVTIEESAFSKCKKLMGITIGNDMATIEERAFQDTAYYNEASNWDESGVLYIGDHLIEAKSTVSGTYTVKAGTKAIAERAFAGSSYDHSGVCSNLTGIVIPDSVVAIGGEAFQACTGLISVTIGSGVTEIRKSAFSGCTGLTNVTIGSSVTTLGEGAFAGCTGLTSIVIPDSVTSIGSNVFESCSKLTDIRFKGTVEKWQATKKDYSWNYKISNYTVTCTDGTVDEKGNVTYFGE